MAVRIAAATAADIPALTQLLAELFGIEQDFSPDTSRQQRGLALLIQDVERAHVAVARDHAGRAVGMVTAQLVISTAEGTRSAWIEDMVVAAEFRRRGVGRALLEAVLAWATGKGATRAQLLVDLDNLPALGYYDHLGWQATRLGARRMLLSR